MKNKKVVFSLSIADLVHEWILTACIIMAITAVLSPLLLLFGLKYGIIDWGRTYLKDDPRYREIRPLVSRSFNKEWFQKIEDQLKIDFIVPMTRQISASVDAQVKGKEEKERLDIVPTDENDPLLLENGSIVPDPNECVLSHYAAEALAASKGDILEITASRIQGNRYEYGKMTLKVAGILSLRAGTLKNLYVRLEILEAVERFKDGRAVPEFGWEGSIPEAYPVYNGVIIVLPEALSKTEVFRVYNKTGFTKIEEIDTDMLYKRTGFRVDGNRAVYHLYTLRKPVYDDSVKMVKNRLRGKDAVLIPIVKGITAEIYDTDNSPVSAVSLQTLSVDETSAKRIGLSPRPPWNDTAPEIRTIMLPSEQGFIAGKTYRLVIRNEDRSLDIPVQTTIDLSVTGSVAFVPERLGGIFNLFMQTDVDYDPDLKAFVLGRRGYAGFRMYARSIYEVDTIRKHFEAASIPVNTQMLEIKKVMDLDRGMSVIFWLLAAVAVAGSAASLIASLYASVERKRKEMSILRLIGLSGSNLFRFPIYQGLIIGAGGFVCSYILFIIFSNFINTGFRSYAEKMLGFPLEEGTRFCRLPLEYILGVIVFVLIISGAAATIAAFRATHIDPADALRDE